MHSLESRRLLSATLTPFIGFNGANGSKPNDLVADSSGDLFGITAATVSNNIVGPGEVFEIPAGTTTMHVIALLTTSSSLGISLQVDSSGNLFGTTFGDGDGELGTIFEIAKGSSTVQTLTSFSSGAQAGDGLEAIDPQGDLFGDSGLSAFELSAGTTNVTTVSSPDAGAYTNNVTEDRAGDLFGTTINGGLNGDGSIFEIPAGSTTPMTIASFDGSDNGSHPLGVSIDSNGDLFGVTSAGGQFGFGTYYEVVAGTNQITVITSFQGGQQGQNFTDKGLLDSNGNYFLLTTSGGASDDGDIIEIPAGSSDAQDVYDLDNSQIASDGDGIIQANNSYYVHRQFGSGGSDNNGAIEKFSPDNGGSGGGGPTGGSGLSGNLSGSAPSSTIAGQKAKISQALTLTNSSGATVTGSAALYLSSDGTIDANSILLTPKSKTIKLKNGAHAKVTLIAASIPASTPNGTYTPIAQLTTASGTTDAASSSTITVAPAEIDLSGSFVTQPVPGKGGKTKLSLSVTNNGNTTASGPLSINIDSSSTQSTSGATVITPASKKINIKPNSKPAKISLPVTLPAGTYFLVIQLDPDNAFNDTNLANNVFATTAAITIG
ncbi:MAG TPA: choice-of-anchor tandem repeat GloVer-containing protein [Tepidisphaeraceae bacterium]